MTSLRALTGQGLRVLRDWLDNPTAPFPADLKDANEYTELTYDLQVDEAKPFATRYDFGEYLNTLFVDIGFHELRAPKNDGLWAWLAVMYLPQLAPTRVKAPEHYIVTRKGPKGSLAYRHAARSAFELVHIHLEHARVCLSVPMDTWGEMAEQLAARQTLAHHRGFFQAAHSLYFENGKLRRGVSSRPKKASERKPGDRVGFGSARRLALALKRLDLTFDTEIMTATSMLTVLPKEFRRWGNVAAG
ncbi:MAG: hypothetical protein ABI972_16630 [Acidobacteriota bacterium]